MKMKNLLSIIATIALLISCSTPNFNNNSANLIKQNRYNFTTLSFPAKDKVRVYADYYDYNVKSAPLILMYHGAGFSRGMFRNIAPKLVDLGYNVLAVDLRSGDKVDNIENLTHNDAINKGKSIEFVDTITDLETSLEYAKKRLKSKNIIFWGSSYSASLGFYMAAKYPNDYKALIAFSPGEYLKIDDKTIADYANIVKIPVYIASAKKEEKDWKSIYDTLPNKKQFFLPNLSEGLHGTMVLNPSYNGAEEYWKNIILFFKKMK